MIGTKILEEANSKFNGKLRIVRTLGMGTYIQAEGITQSGGIVETIWRQTLRFLNRKPLTVNYCLILGLGGGTVAKLIRKKWPDAKITGIEIDPVMVELGKKYLNLDGSEVDIKIADAFQFVNNKSSITNHYDLVVVDLYNGDKFPAEFETDYYIRLARSVLASGGVAVFNRLYYGDKRPSAVKFGKVLEKKFTKVDWFYPEANLMFICKK